MDKMHEILEFNMILDILKQHALSDNAKTRIDKLEPFLSESEAARHLNETTESRFIIERYGNPPLSHMIDLEKSLSVLGKGSFLLPEQLTVISQFLTSCRRLKSYLKKAEGTLTAVASYGNSIFEFMEIEDEISRTVRGSQLDDRASPRLADIRRKIIGGSEKVKSKLDSLLRNNKQWFSEDFVSVRNGHHTLPVKRECKNHVAGTVIDMSQSGGTVFVEPAAARKLLDEIGVLHIEEENEIRRILYALTALVEENLSQIRINIEAMESLDFLFAKAKLSSAMRACPLPVRAKREIVIKAGRHPLLKTDSVVPLDFHIGNGIRGVIITGPNTGGKTVALKTIGLLSLMAQSGLHVPAEDGHFTMNNHILSDIGDRQSITENLSTFSSRMTNIIRMLRIADDQSLVLLDELGSGTDPAEGMGLAIAILEELLRMDCLFVATTHYPEIKAFAGSTPGLVNARMAFDRQSLLPLFRMEIGEAGESCALYIAARLGLPRRMIERAASAAYGSRTEGIHIEAKSLTAVNNASSSEDEAHHARSLQRIKQEPKKASENPRYTKFNIGDSVMIYPQKSIGIVYAKANTKGEIGVQTKKDKLLINHKRLKLHVPADRLYPDDYDFSIVFDSVENRKKRHVMERKHDPQLVIETDDPEV